jgi:hypothetical protein
MKRIALALLLAPAVGAALAKLPPLSDEAKAKAAEAAARTAWGDKVAGFQLCRSMDQVAGRYHADAKKAGRPVAATATAACADPGPFVSPSAAPAPAAAAMPAAKPVAAAPAKKT